MRYALVYGGMAGAIIAATISALLAADYGHSLWVGYLVMLVGLTLVFVGMKRYRDVEKGGVTRFLPAFGVGVGMAAVAAIFYVAIWEGFVALTHYDFMGDYIASIRHARESAGISGPALAREMAELEAMRVRFANPLFRLPMIFLEIFPVGLVVALVSAALLRNPRFMPAAG